MAKFETRIKADLDHLMEYVHNSLRADYLPAALLESEERVYEDVKIVMRKYAVDAGPTIVLYTAKADDRYIYVEVINTGMFASKMVFEEGGSNYEKYLADVFAAYDPTKTNADNRYAQPVPQNSNVSSSVPADSFGKILGGILKLFIK